MVSLLKLGNYLDLASEYGRESERWKKSVGNMVGTTHNLLKIQGEEVFIGILTLRSLASLSMARRTVALSEIVLTKADSNF